jgi:hypothetical protein
VQAGRDNDGCEHRRGTIASASGRGTVALSRLTGATTTLRKMVYIYNKRSFGAKFLALNLLMLHIYKLVLLMVRI